MLEKIKTNTINKNLTEAAGHMGLIMMTAAATLGMIELPEHFNSRVVLIGQPAKALASELAGEASNPIRREREESPQHFVSYSIAQRTPPRSSRT